MKGGGWIFWMCGQILSAERLSSENDHTSAWHSFLIIYKDRNFVVDPAYGAGGHSLRLRAIH